MFNGWQVQVHCRTTLPVKAHAQIVADHSQAARVEFTKVGGGCAECLVNQLQGFPKVGCLASIVLKLAPDSLVGSGQVDKGRVLDQCALTGTDRNVDVLPVAFTVQYPIAVHPAFAFVFDDVKDKPALNGRNELEITDVGKEIRLHDPERFVHK
ncbi:hypothetical protein ALP64_205146 [Pseudomonas syringae pv. actinidiae]|nr:hypothetical protein ALP64_205146 [Pseudomonas syringae pv. actinidiae]